MKATGKYIIVKAIQEPEEKKVILSLEKKKPANYYVVSVGEQVKEIAVGNIVYLNMYSVRTLDIKGEEYIVVADSEVYATDGMYNYA